MTSSHPTRCSERPRCRLRYSFCQK